MSGTPEALYDAHAARIYAYCWALVGDGADAATRDTFVAAMQHPPHGDAVLWMYALARSVCLEHGALSGAFSPGGAARRAGRSPDPLLRAAARLRADHREVLLLSVGQWLDEPDIAVVLGVAPDTVRQLLHTARVRLERAVVDLLMREPGSPYDQEIITAFERGMLPRLLARRAVENLCPNFDLITRHRDENRSADGVAAGPIGVGPVRPELTRAGETFNREVEDRYGDDALSVLWSDPSRMPTAAELADPTAWAARVLLEGWL